MLKEGLARDWTNREKIADLLLFEVANTEPGKFTTLAEYVEKMPAEQKDIYYLIGDSAEQLRHSPYLEAFQAKGQDVLLLTDPIDEFAIPGARRLQGQAPPGRRPRAKPSVGRGRSRRREGEVRRPAERS